MLSRAFQSVRFLILIQNVLVAQADVTLSGESPFDQFDPFSLLEHGVTFVVVNFPASLLLKRINRGLFCLKFIMTFGLKNSRSVFCRIIVTVNYLFIHLKA